MRVDQKNIDILMIKKIIIKLFKNKTEKIHGLLRCHHTCKLIDKLGHSGSYIWNSDTIAAINIHN